MKEGQMGKRLFRQGDVLIVATRKKTPEVAPLNRDGGRIVLAYGENTGHAHAIADREATLHALPDTDDRFLEVLAQAGVALTHEEHATIVLPKGNYIIRQQREYSPVEIRRVAD